MVPSKDSVFSSYTGDGVGTCTYCGVNVTFDTTHHVGPTPGCPDIIAGSVDCWIDGEESSFCADAATTWHYPRGGDPTRNVNFKDRVTPA